MFRVNCGFDSKHDPAISLTRALTSLGGLLLAGVGSLPAQSLTGAVFDGTTGRPVRGAYVVLVSASGAEAARALTGATGEFAFPLPPATGRLRVERIGYEDVVFSEPVVIDGGPYRVTVVGPRRTFDATDPGMTAACSGAPGPDTATGMVWDEVKKALAAARWTVEKSPLAYRASLFERILDSTGLVRRETTRMVSGPEAQPRSGVATGLVDSLGIVVMTSGGVPVFGLPTPDVLLAGRWFESHCFSLQASTSEDLIGLSFAPAGADDRPDIQGSFWVNRETAELRSLQYEYTGVPASLLPSGGGGALTFARLETGEWMVSAWEQTLPRDSETRHKVGGVLTAFSSGGEMRFEDPRVNVVSGAVFDSTADRALPGAVVALLGTDVWTTTDAAGGFFLTGLFDGRYDLIFGHPRLDSLGFISPRTRLVLRPRQSLTLALAAPPLDRILASRCPGRAPSPFDRVVFGIVRDPSGQPAPGVEVTASWQSIPPDLQGFAVDDLQASAVSDTLGTYTLCGVSVGRRVVVHAGTGDSLSEFVSVVFDGEAVQVGNGRGTLGDRPVARIDLTLAGVGARRTAVRGTVTEAETGQPINGAQVIVSGADVSTVTDASGRFELFGLPPGTHRLTARRVGYRQVRYELELSSGEELDVLESALAMPGGAIELAPIIVQADAVPSGARHLVTSGFLERRDQGFGRFVTRDEFETWRPTETTDVLRRTGGIRVTPNPAYGFDGDTRKYLIASGRANVARLGGGECPALYFVDGVYFGNSEDPSSYIDTMIAVGNIEAIEIYSGPSQTPPRFNRPGAECGVIVFWTR